MKAIIIPALLMSFSASSKVIQGQENGLRVFINTETLMMKVTNSQNEQVSGYATKLLSPSGAESYKLVFPLTKYRASIYEAKVKDGSLEAANNHITRWY
ncbi:MAG: hypothetical protein CME64_11575 [Halobacteriovoraceae bacterium]|nr:hypothetical protein [Halobacteriovoraceae bacterium]|tara:strand:+ start:65505 stop:65801 length:297 start_codon:yes stop_codon:yes gene_type:complete